MANNDVPAPPNPNPAVRYSRPTTTGDTVTIACKLPAGVILRVFEWHDYMEPLRDGTLKESRRAIPVPDAQFVVRGTWISTAGQAYNRNNGAVADLLPGGYAITEGCPKAIWDTWLEQNKQSDLVKNGIIFAFPDRNSVVEEVKKRPDVVSGLEPIDRSNPAAKMGSIPSRLRFGILEQGEDR
jgi:hypothetical protein